MEDVKKYPDKPWDWAQICTRSDIFNASADEIAEFVQRRHATKVIARAVVLRAWTDPSYEMCKRRLRRELKWLMTDDGAQ